MSRLVAAKEASLAVIPPASTLAQFITHHVRCHFTLPDTVSKEDLIIPPVATEAPVLYPQSRGQVCSSRIRATRDATLADTLIRTDCSSVTS